MANLPQKFRDLYPTLTTVCSQCTFGRIRRRNEISFRNFRMEMRRKKTPRARCCFHYLLVIYVTFSTILAFLYLSNNVLIPRGLYLTVSVLLSKIMFSKRCLKSSAYTYIGFCSVKFIRA